MPSTATPPLTRPVSQAVFDFYLELNTRWPETFNLQEPKPLQIGIDKAVKAHIPVPQRTLKQFFRWYTDRKPYLKAIAKGTHRYGLSGEPHAALSEPDRINAQRRLRARKRLGPRPAAEPTEAAAPAADAAAPAAVSIWDEFFKHKDELAMELEINATLKVVLRDKPQMRESEDGSVLFSAMQNVPKGLPKGAALPAAPLYLAIPKAMWSKSQKEAEQIEAEGQPVWWMIEGAMGMGADGLLVYAKGVQAIAGKRKAA